jgi:3-polyprenyl-4-hydroxybenzoate decarboxylase
MLDRLRWSFPYIVAVCLPLAGVVIAVVRYTQDDREDALRIALAALVGVCLYGLLFT